MNINSAMTVHAEAFKGRKPGGMKSNNPDKILEKAKGMWGSDPDYNIQLSREIQSECPGMKAMTYAGMTRTQKYNVAKRMHSKAQQRVRAARLKNKRTTV